MFHTFKSQSLVIAIGVVILATATACTTSGDELGDAGSSMSRVRLYDSIEELAADSALIVVGTVESQLVTADIDPITDFTLSTLQVMAVVSGDRSFEGQAVTVRQVGFKEESASPEILDKGEIYLLYLTPSGLDGELAEQYYVTGANAGIYVSVGNDKGVMNDERATFVQYSPQEGESLPSEVRLSEAAGSSGER